MQLVLEREGVVVVRERPVAVAEGFREQAQGERGACRNECEAVEEQLSVVGGELLVEQMGGIAVADRVSAFRKSR